MRSLYSILESIADDDDTKINQSLGDAIIDQLIDNGIYYAKSKLSNNSVQYENGELYFYDHESHLGSSVCIDCNKASKYLKAIKAIHAPIVYFIDADALTIDLPKVYGSRVTIKDAPRSIDNFEFEYEYIGDKFVDWSGYEVKEENFKSITFESNITKGVYIDSYHSNLHLVNCTFKGDNKNVCMLNIHCDDVKFTNLKCDFRFVFMYDPSLFGSGCEMSAKLNKVFDSEYKFTMTGNMDKNNSLRVDRKTRNFDNIVAYFNNRKYKDPSDFPYKVIGKLSDVLDIKGLSNPSLGVQFRNNNVLVEFTKDINRARTIMKSDKVHYAIDGKDMPNFPEITKDKFFVVFAKR